MSKQDDGRAAFVSTARTWAPPCRKTREDDGGRSLTWWDPENGVCGWCGDRCVRCPECQVPPGLHHDFRCSQPCGVCEAAAERRRAIRVVIVEDEDGTAAPRLVICCSRCGDEETMSGTDPGCGVDELSAWQREHVCPGKLGNHRAQHAGKNVKDPDCPFCPP
jgi:hypothetical protein